MPTDDSPEREIVVYDREDFPRAPLEDEEGPSNVSANENEDVEKPKARRTPRREVRWLDLGAKKRTLESIKRRFEDCLDRFRSSSSNSLLRRITSPRDSKQRHDLHQCPGYLREEITLASDVSKSVIVSYAFPSQSEVCSICGQLVQYNRTEHSIVDGESNEQPSQQRQRDSPSRFPRIKENLNNAEASSSRSTPNKDTTNLSASSGFIDKDTVDAELAIMTPPKPKDVQRTLSSDSLSFAASQPIPMTPDLSVLPPVKSNNPFEMFFSLTTLHNNNSSNLALELIQTHGFPISFCVFQIGKWKWRRRA